MQLASGRRTGVDGDEIRDLFAAFDSAGCGVVDWESWCIYVIYII